ncbi:helix-turn-helix domain-containing protein [Nitrosococcus oceani]|nr:helix-turn-helix domain-containing protein [Nitrosococcus oceani]
MAIELSPARFVWNWALETRTKAYQEDKVRRDRTAVSHGETPNNDIRVI